MNALYYRLAFFATILAMVVILLGAYTRLKDAGLGCPDWPGCYGHLSVPKTSSELAHANQLFPQQTVESKKAWLEMIHRYFAGSLGLLIFILTVWSLIRRKYDAIQPVVIPILLSILVIFQAALGMWTVTLSLLPLVVVGHLLGGILIAGLLWVLTLSSMKGFRKTSYQGASGLKIAAIIGVVMIFGQIFLGGWVSANYAALICPDFPGCHGRWFPLMKMREAFNFLSPIGTNYEGGVLDSVTRATIQMVHRYGAVLVLLYMGALSLYLMISRQVSMLRGFGWSIFLLLWLQILLGVLNILLMLPVPVALAHNFVAVLLFLSMLTLLCRLYFKSASAFNS